MNNHRALIVEDERDMAAEIGDLLGSMGYDHVAIDNLADGRRLLDEGEFCFVLLDLQIKAEKFSIRPRVEAGMTFLRELRQKHPRRGENDMHLLPVIVVSGHAKEHEDIVRAFQAGANDFVRKPLGQFGQDLSAKIEACLDRSGRHSHAACCTNSDDLEATCPVTNITHSPDYREVWFRGDLFMFGELQAKVIRHLHEAWKSGSPWVAGKAILRRVGSDDVAAKLANLFRRHPAWQRLLLSNGRGLYRLADA
jgi:DNA-binding response OmpR family regulator